MTPSANLDLVRSIYAAWERGDYSSAEWAHPEIEAVMADGPSPSTRTGVAGMAAVWRDAANVWAGYRSEAEVFRELDGERVLVLMRQHGRGKASGLDLAEMRTKAATVFHVREGKVTRIIRYWDRERAFADLGLSPEGGSP